MLEKVKALRDQYAKAETEQERDLIQKETDLLKEQDPEAWADAMLDCIKDTNRRAKELNIRRQMEEINQIISVSYLAKEYFGKTPQWFYQRMNQNEVNGKPAQFTQEEIDILNEALQDISKKIGSVKLTA